jgi:O-antigen biosynthesis protein
MASGGSAPPPEEVLDTASLLAESLLHAEEEISRLTGIADRLEERLLAIDASRSMRLIRLPGRVFLDWRGRLGQWLLHSPLHPFFLKIAHPASLDRLYGAWAGRELRATPPGEWFATRGKALSVQPTFSILMPVHNPSRQWLSEAVESVRSQYYPNWELCICDDASTTPWLPKFLEDLASGDRRIRFVRATGPLGISGALNQAASLARGGYAGVLDHDDTLAPFALYYVAEALQHVDAEIVYSDEDRLNEAGIRVEPIFKPAWSPDLLLGCMYLGHFLVVKRSRLEAAGGFRSPMDGSQDHDLALRLSDGPVVVRHIPRVLYHWRKHPGSTSSSSSAKPYAQVAGLAAVREAVERRGIAARVVPGPRPNTYTVQRPVKGAGKVSLVICSRREDLLRHCLRAIDRTTGYADRETVVVQHGLDMNLNGFRGTSLRYDGEFNFARMNNLGAHAASGDWLIFLNDDVVPLRRGWVDALAEHIARAEVGVVGAKLLYPSGAIQHAGMATGIMEATGHPHRDTFGSPFWGWSDLTRNVSAVTGACLAIRQDTFRRLDGFDERFAVNFNDTDLCLRARQLGLEVIYAPAALLQHNECQTRTPGTRWRECALWRQTWPAVNSAVDPFYSPHLTTEREDASLRLDEPMTPEDNSR